MDKIKGLAEKAKGGSSSSSSSGGGQQDYVDKGLSSVEQKTGHQQSAATNEKITDKGREFYEKQTGSNVPDKVSN